MFLSGHFISFLIGAYSGRFINLLVDRLPKGKPIFFSNRHCPYRTRRKPWLYLIPILSYFLLKGDCTNCNTKTDPTYPTIEFITGIIFVLVFYCFGLGMGTLIYWALISALITVIIADFKYFIIPDEVNLFIFILGIAAIFFNITVDLRNGLLGSLLGGGILLTVAIVTKGAMGGGDIKLAFGLGLFTGWQMFVLLLFLASLLGTLYGLVQILRKGYEIGHKIPFGVFLALAVLVILFGGEALVACCVELFYY